MLRWRLILGVLLIAGLAGLCWLDAHAARPGVYLGPLAIVAAAARCGRDAANVPLLKGISRRRTTFIGTLLPVIVSCLAVIGLLEPPVFTLGRLGWLALAAGRRTWRGDRRRDAALRIAGAFDRATSARRAVGDLRRRTDGNACSAAAGRAVRLRARAMGAAAAAPVADRDGEA